MALSFAGNGTITGLSVGGLPDGTVDEDTLANNAVGSGKLASGVGGKCLQIKYNSQTGLVSGSGTFPMDDTIPQISEGNSASMDLAITPSSSSNRLLIQVSIATSSSSGGGCVGALFQDSTANALACSFSYNHHVSYPIGTVAFAYEMSAGTTSATTFKVRFGSHTGTSYLNNEGANRRYGGTCTSSITIFEYST